MFRHVASFSVQRSHCITSCSDGSGKLSLLRPFSRRDREDYRSCCAEVEGCSIRIVSGTFLGGLVSLMLAIIPLGVMGCTRKPEDQVRTCSLEHKGHLPCRPRSSCLRFVSPISALSRRVLATMWRHTHSLLQPDRGTREPSYKIFLKFANCEAFTRNKSDGFKGTAQ